MTLAMIDTWVTYVETNLKRRPMIYTGSYFWDDNKLGAKYAGYPLWTAHYTTNPCPLVPNAWSAWAFWQYSSKGTVSGISGAVDLDVFNGTVAQLDALIASSKLGASADSGSPGDSSTSDRPALDVSASDGASTPRDRAHGEMPPPLWDGRQGDAGLGGDAGCSCGLCATSSEDAPPPGPGLLALLGLAAFGWGRRHRPRRKR